MKITMRRPRQQISIFKKERLVLLKFADGGVFGLRIPSGIEPVKTVYSDVIVVGRQ